MFQVYLGEFEKMGKLLNLNEIHERICENHEHSNLQYRDLVCDVVVSKCIFNFLIWQFKPIQLFRYDYLFTKENMKKKKKE